MCMPQLLYISHLRQKSQKSLAYALGLANSLSSQLSLVYKTGLGNPQQKSMTIWRPEKNGEWDTIKYGNHPVFLLGKPKLHPESHTEEYQILKQVMELDAPLLVIPYNYPFNGIRNILFTGNAPGLTDHLLTHHLAATFLPRVFKIEQSKLKQIHWNNISHIPETEVPTEYYCHNQLNRNIQQHTIDLTVFPVTRSPFTNQFCTTMKLQKIFLLQRPALLIPLLTQESIVQTSKHQYERTNPVSNVW